MLGNEAIARGAVEAGVGVVASYPGTPSSELTQALVDAAKDIDLYVEWSVNEKVAFEVALAASMCGIRAMAVMKHVGVNVAHDPLMTASYMGAKGGLVLVSADDPEMWSSQNEQDNRYIGIQGYIPVLEPSSAQEAKDMMADAFKLSEEFEHMFMLRSVTRISHARSDVVLGKIAAKTRKGRFEKDPSRWVCLPANERKNRRLLIGRLSRIKKAVNSLHYNQLTLVEGAKQGIIACGISYTYVLEALRWLGLENEIPLLKIGTPYPMPEELTKKFLESVPELLVVEELEPIVENQVKVIAKDADIPVKIHGKNLVPLIGELSIRRVVEAVSKFVGARPPVNFTELDRLVEETEPLVPSRPPTLCPGCPHRATFYAINIACRHYKRDFGVEPVRPGDIGCYTLGYNPPLNSDDMAICMGGAFGIGNGLSHVIEAPVVAHLGDSTFFHSGIPPMINAVYNKANITMVVMDNSATAQTGFQPHPGTGSTAQGAPAPKLKPENIARACEVEFVEVIDPFELKETIDTIERALRFDGPAVVVCRRICRVLEQREWKRRRETTIPCRIDLDKCNGCRLCITALGCPAIILEDKKVAINTSQCNGCGVCAQICPVNAIIQQDQMG
jgi:indolepyruvate ferredoxin oxidoreductase alpha subunit